MYSVSTHDHASTRTFVVYCTQQARMIMQAPVHLWMCKINVNVLAHLLMRNTNANTLTHL